MSRIETEIETFVQAQVKLKSAGLEVKVIDEFGFIICGNDQSQRIDILITGLMHGNEVIGVEVINQIIAHFIQNPQITINLGLLLCHPEAARRNVRYIESDLNRSFSVANKNTLEHHRAAQIAKIVDQTDFVFDLHQTIEPSLNPFLVMEHRHELIQIADQLLSQFPIVTFGSEGFSVVGKTMLEYSYLVGTKAIVIEIGQKGFNQELATQVTVGCIDLIKALAQFEIKKSKNISVLHLETSISSMGNTQLVPGLVSYQKIKRGQVLAHQGEIEIKSPFDGRLVFPSYGEKSHSNYELCNLGKLINYTDVN